MHFFPEEHSFDPEGDLFFPFYSTYLEQEDHKQFVEDPHERLTTFYLAIQELLGAGKHALAFGIYQDLITKKRDFHLDHYPCQEEIQDMLQDITSVMRNAGVFASSNDLSL